MRRMGFCGILTKKIIDSYDKDFVKYSNWALSNLCRGDVTNNEQRESVSAFVKVILTFKDEEMIKDALVSLVDLMENSMIDSFIKADLLKTISQIAQQVNDSHVFMKPIINIVCMVNAGTHEQCKHCIDCGFADIFFKWLQIPNIKKGTIKEILYCMSNFTIDSDEIASFILSNQNYYDILKQLCYHDNSNVRTEAIWNFCNACKVCDAQKVYKMVQNGIFKLFADALDPINPPDTILIVFQGLKHIFNKQQEILDMANGNDVMDFQLEAQNSGLCDKIEECQNHSSMNVYLEAQYVIKAYFAQEVSNSVLDKFYNYVRANEKID